MVKPQAKAVHAEVAIKARRPAFPQLEPFAFRWNRNGVLDLTLRRSAPMPQINRRIATAEARAPIKMIAKIRRTPQTTTSLILHRNYRIARPPDPASRSPRLTAGKTAAPRPRSSRQTA